MQATRERKERFLLSFPANSHGWPAVRRDLHMYSDTGVDALVADFIWAERLRIKINRENRSLAALSNSERTDG